MISFMTEERLAASLPWQPVHNAPQSGGPDFGVAGSRAWSSCLGFAPNASSLKAPGRIGPPVGRGERVARCQLWGSHLEDQWRKMLTYSLERM